MGSGVKGTATILSGEDCDIKSGDEELLEDCWAQVAAGLDER